MKKNVIIIPLLLMIIMAIFMIYQSSIYQVTLVINNQVWKTVKIAKNTPLNMDNPTIEGKTFIGWYDHNDTLYDSKTKITDNSTLYAKFATIVTE